jgi:hypothetical protein
VIAGSAWHHIPVRRGAVIAGAVVIITLSAATDARGDRALAPRFAATERGSTTLTGNTVLSCPAVAFGCLDARNGVDGAPGNDLFVMSHVDVDGDSSTFNSSGAALSLPAGATVVFTGLYWGADTSAGSR